MGLLLVWKSRGCRSWRPEQPPILTRKQGQVPRSRHPAAGGNQFHSSAVTSHQPRPGLLSTAPTILSHCQVLAASWSSQ